jgi:hypothetical protein
MKTIVVILKVLAGIATTAAVFLAGWFAHKFFITPLGPHLQLCVKSAAIDPTYAEFWNQFIEICMAAYDKVMQIGVVLFAAALIGGVVFAVPLYKIAFGGKDE